MNLTRRQLLATTGTALAAGLAGCTSSEPTDSPPETTSPPTQPPTPQPTTREPTTTRQPEPPEILEVALVSEFSEYGDVQANPVTAVGKGATALLGYHHETTVHDGTLNITTQVKVFGPSGRRVDSSTHDDEQLVSGNGRQEWQNVHTFDTTGWDLGDYEFGVLIRDNVTNTVSETARGTFTLNSPLGPQDASLQSVFGPDAVGVGEDYAFTLNFSNTSERDGSVVSTISGKWKSESSWYTYPDSSITATMAAGGTGTWESSPITFENTGTFQYRLDALDEIWEVEVAN